MQGGCPQEMKALLQSFQANGGRSMAFPSEQDVASVNDDDAILTASGTHFCEYLPKLGSRPLGLTPLPLQAFALVTRELGCTLATLDHCHVWLVQLPLTQP